MTTSAVVIHVDGWRSDISLEIRDHPRRAEGRFVSGKAQRRLAIVNPQPLEAILAIFQEWYGLRVIDQNAEEGNHLEFGRFRVEFEEEDGGIMASCLADGCELFETEA